MHSKQFIVNEWFNGYEVKHIASGKTHWMGDGVDRVEELGAESAVIGTEAFRQAWEDELNANPAEILEAYFPEEGK